MIPCGRDPRIPGVCTPVVVHALRRTAVREGGVRAPPDLLRRLPRDPGAGRPAARGLEAVDREDVLHLRGQADAGLGPAAARDHALGRLQTDPRLLRGQGAPGARRAGPVARAGDARALRAPAARLPRRAHAGARGLERRPRGPRRRRPARDPGDRHAPGTGAAGEGERDLRDAALDRARTPRTSRRSTSTATSGSTCCSPTSASSSPATTRRALSRSCAAPPPASPRPCAGTASRALADVEPGDFDGDGRLDLLVSAFGWRAKGNITVMLNRTTDWSEAGFRPRGARRAARRRRRERPRPRRRQEARRGRAGLAGARGGRRLPRRRQGRLPRGALYKAPHPNWGSTGLTVVDLDKDGDLDCIVTNGDMFDDDILKPYHAVSGSRTRASSASSRSRWPPGRRAQGRRGRPRRRRRPRRGGRGADRRRPGPRSRRSCPRSSGSSR